MTHSGTWYLENACLSDGKRPVVCDPPLLHSQIWHSRLVETLRSKLLDELTCVTVGTTPPPVPHGPRIDRNKYAWGAVHDDMVANAVALDGRSTLAPVQSKDELRRGFAVSDAIPFVRAGVLKVPH